MGQNDERDAADLADLLRMGRLPEPWIATPQICALRELVRHRASLVALRSSLKCGVTAPMSDLFGKTGTNLFDRLGLEPEYMARTRSLRAIIDGIDVEI